MKRTEKNRVQGGKDDVNNTKGSFRMSGSDFAYTIRLIGNVGCHFLGKKRWLVYESGVSSFPLTVLFGVAGFRPGG